jgi:ADP-heptose:LPS heptosyltransferase
MRRVDYWVGVPASFVVGVVVRTLDRFRPQRRKRPRRVLFIELSEMGSTILAAPALQRVIHQYEQKPCFVIFEKNAHSLRLLGLFDEDDICTIRSDSVVAMLVDIWRFVGFCRRKRVDAVLDLELYARISSLLAMFSGARTRVGFHNYLAEGLYRGNQLTHRVAYRTYYHMSQNFMALVEALESDPAEVPTPKKYIPVPDQVVNIPRSEAEWQYVRGELEQRGPLGADTRLVILNHDPGMLLPIRAWPFENFTALAKELLAWDPRIVVVLMGVKDSVESGAVIERDVGSDRLINMIGRTRTLSDLIQLFHQAELLITNDSGPAHFATLTNISVITMFGPETARMYGPLGEKAVNIDKELACSPCLTAANHRNSPCTRNVCLEEISVAEVFEQAQRLLAREVAERAATTPAG